MNLSVIAVSVLLAAANVQTNALPHGGFVKVGGKGELAIVNVNCADKSAMTKASFGLSKALMIYTKVTDGKWSLATVAEDLKATGSTAAVFVVKDKNLPMSLIAMESKWGVVNAEGLDESALKKEIIRVATVVIGGASSKYPASFMRPVFSPDDLAKSGEMFTIDTLMLLFPNLGAHGFGQYRSMTFRDALEAGFKPTPVTEEQRKIAAEFLK